MKKQKQTNKQKTKKTSYVSRVPSSRSRGISTFGTYSHKKRKDGKHGPYLAEF